MVRSIRLGLLLVVVGVVIALLSFGFGGATDRACPGIGSILYETIGVAPGRAAITGVDVAAMTLEWYDGCNWRTLPLAPLVAGPLVSVAGIAVAASAWIGE